jgi:II/X family phage/plasmid replication protein
MIDWLTMEIPLRHTTPINGGEVVSIDPFGNLEWRTLKRTTVTGSHEMNLQVRTCTHTPDYCSHLSISGNPAKFLQGHNLWGSDDIHGLAIATCERVASLLGIDVHPDDYAQWIAGAIKLTRVDVTQMFELRNQAEVLSWIRAAEQTAYMSHRGRGRLIGGTTLTFGEKSRRRRLKAYAKGLEVRKNIKAQPAIRELSHALEYADRCLRVELELKAMELKRIGLDTIASWSTDDGVPCEAVTAALLREELGNMTMTTTASLAPDVMQNLRPALRMAVQAWESGADLRETLPRPTFYKYRKELLPFGIDIATLLPKDVSNVVPLHRVLEAKPVGVPDWAIGTPLYFEPRLIA